MKVNGRATREELISTPLPLWEDSYTCIPNKTIFDKIDENIRGGGLKVKNEVYRVSRTESGIIKGVIGSIDIMTSNEEYGQRFMFRNSYDKSMSFAVAIGNFVMICENGCVRADNFEYKRKHSGIADSESLLNIDAGFESIDKEFKIIAEQMDNLKQCHVDYELMHNLVGNLFFEQGVISSTQINIIKDQMWNGDKFKHINDADYSAYDLYNNITESLKKSNVYSFIQDHAKTHKLFENTFLKQSEPVIIDTPVLEEA